MRWRIIVQREKTSAGVALGWNRSGGEKVVMRVVLGREWEELPEEDVVLVVLVLERARWVGENIEERTEDCLVDSVMRRPVRPPPGWMVLSGAIS